MRFLVGLILGSALVFVGCGDDSGTGGSGGTAGTGGTAGSGGMGGTGGDVTGLVVRVDWTASEGCTMNVASDYDLGVLVSGETGEVSISGSVAACSPNIDAVSNVLSCPNNAPYPGSVVVEDDNGSVTVDITITPCEDGSAES